MFTSGSEDIMEDMWSGERRGLGTTQQISRGEKTKMHGIPGFASRLVHLESSHMGRYIEMKLEARCQLYRALNAEFN